MIRRLCVLLLGAGLALAQEEKDDEGITIDEAPSGPEKEPERTEPYPAREPGAKVATVEIKKKIYSFPLPADWVLLDDADERTELSWEVLLPGSKKRATLRLFRSEIGGDPRSAPYYYAQWNREETPDVTTEVFAKPLPRLVVRFKSGWVNGDVFLSVRNNLYFLQLGCSADDIKSFEADLFAAAQSFEAEVEAWPRVPKGYKVTKDGAWVIARAPSVSKPLTALAKALDDAEKRFKRMHGALPKGDAPLVVLVHATKDEAAKVEPRAAERDHGFYADGWRRRLFAIPLDRDDAEQRGWLAGEAHQLLLTAKYGEMRPGWIWVGEGTVARAEALLGKALPSLDEGFVNWRSELKLHKLVELEELDRTDSVACGKESLFHVAALLGGKYAKQYRAFFDDLEETGDALGAFERHLARLDPEQVLAATHDYLNTKIKSERREEKERRK